MLTPEGAETDTAVPVAALLVLLLRIAVAIYVMPMSPPSEAAPLPGDPAASLYPA